MFNDDDLGLRLHTFMDREIARSRPASIEVVRTRSRRHRRFKRLTIIAVAASLLVIVGASLALVAHRPSGEVSAAPDSRVGIVILPGSGNAWVAFAMHNSMTANVGYGPNGVVDRRTSSVWKQVGYFGGAQMGGTRPGSLTHAPPSAVAAVELVAAPGGLGSVEWVDVASLSPGTYRLRQTVDLIGPSPSTGNHQLRHATATGEFRITEGSAPQAPPLERDARLDPEPAVVSGTAGALALDLVGGTGDLNQDLQVERSLARVVHIRKWQPGGWADVATRPTTPVENVTSVVSLPQLAPGLYELIRTKPSGRGAIDGWLFVTHAVKFAAPPTQLSCRVTLGTQSKTVSIRAVIGASDSVRIGAYTTKFTMLIPPTNGFGLMRADWSGPTSDARGQSEGGVRPGANTFSGRVPTPKGVLAYACSG